MSQDGRPIVFFPENSTMRKNWTVTENELLAIVEILKNFRSLLLGQNIRVHTDHTHLTYTNTELSCDRILRHRLVIEGYRAEIVFIPGGKNVVVDALSRLGTNSRELQSFKELFLQRRLKMTFYCHSILKG